MKSIQQLHDTADKERQKSTDLRGQADKQRIKSLTNPENPDFMLQSSKEAQKLEEKAALHDQEAANLVQEATALEAKALEIERRKNDIQQTSQAEIARLEQEEQALRGESRGMF